MVVKLEDERTENSNLQKQYEGELKDLKTSFSVERQQIEESFRTIISKLEESHVDEKKALENSFNVKMVVVLLCKFKVFKDYCIIIT